MDVTSFIPKAGQDKVNPITSEDRVDPGDGLLICTNCGEKKQKRIKFMGKEMVVPVVCRCRKEEIERKKKTDEHNERMIRIQRLRGASMMTEEFRRASFKNYTIRDENEKVYRLAVNYCRRFPEMKKKNQGLLFYGPTGSGKSYTAACIANALLEMEVSVIMTSFVKILADIHLNEKEAEYIQVLNSATLLIIDDLGAERDTEYATEKVYNVIDSRVREGKPMILTTNLALSDMLECRDIQKRRIYDRIFEACFPAEVAGKSFRKIEAAKRFEDMKKLMV